MKRRSKILPKMTKNPNEERLPLLGTSAENLTQASRYDGGQERVTAPLHKKCLRHPRALSILVSLLLILLGHIVVVYLIYFHGYIKLNVLAFNVWGMPGGIGGCLDKAVRMKALAHNIRSRAYEFDVLMLEELWMQEDQQLLVEAALEAGLYATRFRQLASSYCDGKVLISGCSGLTVISVYPFVEYEFNEYTWKGSIWDGEGLAGKGIGRVRIEPRANLTVDVFVTHTIADSGTTMANNTWYRVKQVQELMDSYVTHSTADVAILGGDFNTPPSMNVGEPYEIIRRHMTNSIEDIFQQLEEWLTPKFATYGNQRNSYSYMYDPITYDYVFYKSNSNRTNVWTSWFELPFLTTQIFKTHKEETVTLSDHEPVIATLYMKKWSKTWPYI